MKACKIHHFTRHYGDDKLNAPMMVCSLVTHYPKLHPQKTPLSMVGYRLDPKKVRNIQI